MSPKARQRMFERLRAANPHPTTELAYSTPFELLVAVILSAQATDVSVNKATGPLFAAANTPQALLALGLAKLKGFVRTIGLYNTKAENILKTCRILLERHGGEVPRDRAAHVEALPGVGSLLWAQDCTYVSAGGWTCRWRGLRAGRWGPPGQLATSASPAATTPG